MNLFKNIFEQEAGLLSRYTKNYRYELFTTEKMRLWHIEKWKKKNPHQKDFCERFFNIRLDFFHRRYYYIKGSSVECVLAPDKKAFYPVIKGEENNFVLIKRSDCKTCEYLISIQKGWNRYQYFCACWKAVNRRLAKRVMSGAIKEANRIMGGIR